MILNKGLHSLTAALLLSSGLTFVLGCSSSHSSANLRESFNTLTVAETLGGLMSGSDTLAIVGRYANCDALPMARKLAARHWLPDGSGGEMSLIAAAKADPESPATRAVLRGLFLLAYIGDSSDARFVERIHRDPAFLRQQLTRMEKAPFPTTNILVLGIMAARRVEAAEEIVNQMVTPRYWHDLGVDEMAPRASCGLSPAFYLAADSLYAYRIGGEPHSHQAENDLLEAVKDPIQRQTLERRIERIRNDPWPEDRIATNGSASCCAGFSIRLLGHRLKKRLFCRKPKFPTVELRQQWRHAYEQNDHLFRE